MKKDIEWLRNKLEALLEFDMNKSIKWKNSTLGERHKARATAIKEALGFLDQLDEPEVLSQEWIDGHKYFPVGEDAVVRARDLKNLIVPKQVLPVIPKYVAEYLELAKSDVSLMRVLEKASRRDEILFLKWEKEYAWISTNDETFARAWLDGYTVAEEQKYYVLDSQDIPLLERANDQTYKTTTGLSICEDGRDNSRLELTEQEIKDHDERFWAFAVLKGECQ